MSLTRKQKKYIKKNIKKVPIDKISSQLKTSTAEIERYLEKKWGKKKYKKLISKQSTKDLAASPETSLSLKKWFSQNKIVILILILLIGIAYVNSTSNEFVSDDINGILKNQHIGKITYVLSNPFSFFHTFILYAIVNLFGKTPAAFRAFNILSHIGVTITLYFLLNILNFSKKSAFFAATIFAVHPILTETVTWVSGGYYSYSAFLVLLSLTAYILANQHKKLKPYILSIFFYFLAIATSEKVISFPIILFLYEISFSQIKKNWKRLIPFFILSFIWGTYLIGAFHIRTVALEKSFYKKPARNPDAASFIEIPAIAATSYLELIFWPKDLSLYHTELTFTQVEFTARIVIFLSILILTGIIYKFSRRAFFFLAFFFIALAPTTTPFGVSWIVAERYVYLGSIGIFAIVGLLLEKIGILLKNEDMPYIILILVLIALTTRTIIRNEDWKNQDTLWIAAAKTSPHSAQNHNNLGDMYARRHDYQKAINEFKQAIKINPRYAPAYHNLANTYSAVGNIEEAIANYKKAIVINPNLWQSYQNLGAIYLHKKNYAKAKEYTEKAVKLNPQNENLRKNLKMIEEALKKNQ